jgi:hypothetical protein
MEAKSWRQQENARLDRKNDSIVENVLNWGDVLHKKGGAMSDCHQR